MPDLTLSPVLALIAALCSAPHSLGKGEGGKLNLFWLTIVTEGFCAPLRKGLLNCWLDLSFPCLGLQNWVSHLTWTVFRWIISKFFSMRICSAFGASRCLFIEAPTWGIDAGLNLVTMVYKASRKKGRKESGWEGVKRGRKEKRKECGMGERKRWIILSTILKFHVEKELN